jgi:hypothetical protein
MSGRTLPLTLNGLEKVLGTASLLIGEGIEMLQADDHDDDAAFHKLIQGDVLLGVVLGSIEVFQAQVPDKLTQDESQD